MASLTVSSGLCCIVTLVLTSHTQKLEKAALCARFKPLPSPCLLFPIRVFPRCCSCLLRWQARRESNPQPAVLETAALPIELLALELEPVSELFTCAHAINFKMGFPANHSITLATTPAPTVRPPSRIAKRKPSSIAIGAINFTVIFTLSPGITISTPSGNSTAPVMSVVRK